MLPDDAIIFDEALTNSPPVAATRRRPTPGQYFLTRGGSLGVGIPGAIGAKLAYPGQDSVIGFTGDGGAMYTIQALWTAARHNIDAKFVVCNNASYRLLQLNIAAVLEGAGDSDARVPADLRPVAAAAALRRDGPLDGRDGRPRRKTVGSGTCHSPDAGPSRTISDRSRARGRHPSRTRGQYLRPMTNADGAARPLLLREEQSL